MSDEHGWPHDDGRHHDELGEHPVEDLGTPEPDEPLAVHEDDAWEVSDEHLTSWEEPHHDEPAAAEDGAPLEEHDDVTAPEQAPVSDEPLDLFPPSVDVGPLPEPVDGFPWIDTGSLGLVDAGLVAPLAQAPDPAELAEYAAEELPPAADPWAALAESEDPATAALAKFYRPDQI